MATNDFKKRIGSKTGPGGLGCPCCAPAPGSPERRKLVRQARREADKDAIEEGLEDTREEEDASENTTSTP